MLLQVLHILIIVAVSYSNEHKTKVYSTCGEVISQHQFIIQSPGYPEKYPTSVNCEYILKGYDVCQTQFHFQFLDFDLEQSAQCVDRLQIGKQDILCGFVNGIKTYKTEGNYLHVNFSSGNVISVPVAGRRFKILITRLPCNENVTSTTVNVDRKFVTDNNIPSCCATSYSSRRFYLASPGFPYSNRLQSDCAYNIYRSNPNICRLRIHFKFFWSGVQENNGNCPYGFFEIDGKQICGCRSGLSLVSTFDQLWDKIPKVIRFKNNGYPRSTFSGFVIEVIQDECPTKYTPSSQDDTSSRSEKLPEFFYYNDQLSRVVSSNLTNDTLPEKVVKKRTELLDDNDDESNVKYYYYFFKEPDFNDDLPKAKRRRDKEQRTYFETTSNDFLLSNNNDDRVCRNWGLLQWNMLTREALWRKMAQCKNAQNLTPKCCEISNFKGCLVSPGYPFYYPGNLNMCYRFQRLTGYCGVKLAFLDFDLETSQNCMKDALILYNTYRYCGNYLTNAYMNFDLSKKPYEDITLSTDAYYCGRGFQLIYEQIPCATMPVTTTPMTTTTIYPPNPKECGGYITAEVFTLSFLKTHQECLYNIQKLTRDVCGLRLLFVNFDLTCNTEYVSINGKLYCGYLTGQSVLVNFNTQDKVSIIYRRSTVIPASTRIVIRGQQVKDNCDPFDLDVPAERRLIIENQPENETLKYT